MRAGIEIALEHDAHTYWRDPGDAGVPPRIAFEGSRNLKRADLRFPAPERIDEGGLKVIGYRRPVILPIEVEAEDPSQPVHLAVQFSYAACAKICTPAEATTSLDLAPGQSPGPHAARLAEAAAALPERVGPGGPVDLAIEAASAVADAKKALDRAPARFGRALARPLRRRAGRLVLRDAACRGRVQDRRGRRSQGGERAHRRAAHARRSARLRDCGRTA